METFNDVAIRHAIEIDRLRAVNTDLRDALSETLARLETEWPDERDGRTASPRTPGLVRVTKQMARAAIAKAQAQS